ncbi:MAG TPA: GAF domain-containing protein [Candidatus Krumholzibacteria bacterium]|nr:GAF domain-containing protein [Candidatus Krumholzibacteria bacterium]
MSNTIPQPNTDAASMGGVQVRINRSSYMNWSLLVIVVLLIAISLASVLPPVLSSRISEFWIFSKPQMLVIAGLTLALLLLAGLAHQMRYLKALRAQFAAIQQQEREQAERHTARLYALLNMGRVMVSQSDLQTVFDSITKLCCEAFGCDQSSLMILDKDAEVLEVRAASGKDIPEGMLGARQPVGRGISGWVAQRREPLLLTPMQTPIPGLEFKKKDVIAAMVVPVILRDELVGVLNVSARSSHVEFNSDDLRAMQAFAENVGAAVRHAEHAEWMRATIRKLQEQKERGAHGAAHPVTPSAGGTDGAA